MPSEAAYPASIRDVARLAGTSAATASRALRGSPSVADPTRDRVLRAARELAYSLPSSPTAHARPIAVLSLSPVQWFYAEAIAAIEQALAAAGRQFVLFNVGHEAGRNHFFERVAPTNQLDGLIMLPAPFDDRELTAIDRLGVPAVTVGQHMSPYPNAGIDDRAAARLAVRHLIGLGHRDIGLISFDLDDPVGRALTADRRQGFESALTEAGVSVNPDWMVKAHDSRMNGGIAAAEHLLGLPSQPTALFAMSDELAIGALRTLGRAGITVPQRVSVIGFDDHEMAEFMDLTTIRQPVWQQAQEATRMLLEQLGGTPRPSLDPASLSARLVIRGTTGPRPGR